MYFIRVRFQFRYHLCFFFSSRRRHTRWPRDWSSDVCSSDLEPESLFEGVLDHGERDGWGLWLDPSIAEDPIWKEHWAGVEAVVVKVAEDSIVLEADGGEASSIDESAPPTASTDGTSEDGVTGPSRERGRVKWFDAEKGYGFLIRPTGEDLFVHHSEVQGDPSELSPNGDVEYEVGRNDRGPNARRVRTIG